MRGRPRKAWPVLTSGSELDLHQDKPFFPGARSCHVLQEHLGSLHFPGAGGEEGQCNAHPPSLCLRPTPPSHPQRSEPHSAPSTVLQTHMQTRVDMACANPKYEYDRSGQFSHIVGFNVPGFVPSHAPHLHSDM